MSGGPGPSRLDLSKSPRRMSFEIEDIGEWEILVPQSVYPPREDTYILAQALGTIERGSGLAVEIGCGSGAIAILLASLGWRVEGCDVNPIAVAAARGNALNAGLSDRISIKEGGVGEPGWTLPVDASLVVWNLPYLDPVDEGEKLEPIEDASMLDISGGWSDLLLQSIQESDVSNDCLVVMLQRTDPPSQSKSDSWLKAGWACRTLHTLRTGEERLEAICYWKPAKGMVPVVLDECISTMDEAKELDAYSWGRVLSLSQATGRGRRGSRWETMEGGLACTWVIPFSDSEMPNPGMLQTSIGSALSSALGCYCKWPNDLIDQHGKKLGGVLVESSTSESAVRVGVGINREATVVDGTEVSGWLEHSSEMELMEAFALVDATLASLFESHSNASQVTESDLIEISWRGLANSLSRGIIIWPEDGSFRVVGLDRDGSLELESRGEVSITDDVGGLDWIIPSV